MNFSLHVKSQKDTRHTLPASAANAWTSSICAQRHVTSPCWMRSVSCTCRPKASYTFTRFCAISIWLWVWSELQIEHFYSIGYYPPPLSSGPMVCLYLLGQPDHYSSHEFAPLNWRIFVNEVLSYWKPSDTDPHTPDVSLYMANNQLVAISPAYDYKHRPKELEHMALYHWACQWHKVRLSKKQRTDDDSDISVLRSPSLAHVSTR